MDKKTCWKIVTEFKHASIEISVQKKDKHGQCYLLFFNKASLLYACLDAKIILWSRQRGTFKLANAKHEHRTECQSLVNSLSLSFLVYWTEIIIMQSLCNFLC